MQARILLDTGRRAEAAEMLREALAICKEAGTQFCGPKVTSALSRAVDDPAERAALLAEGKEMLRRGAVGHNHLWFYRDAIEALLSAGDGAGALEYVAALENYTRAEPLPWSVYSPTVVASSPVPREATSITACEKNSIASAPRFVMQG